jgi:hypothetical protein
MNRNKNFKLNIFLWFLSIIDNLKFFVLFILKKKINKNKNN